MSEQQSSRQPPTLLGTKLHVPRVVADQVERPRLLQAVDRILQPGRRLLLLSAPAGFGKTSLLDLPGVRGQSRGFRFRRPSAADPEEF
jgi:hypothetical protein